MFPKDKFLFWNNPIFLFINFGNKIYFFEIERRELFFKLITIADCNIKWQMIFYVTFLKEDHVINVAIG